MKSGKLLKKNNKYPKFVCILIGTIFLVSSVVFSACDSNSTNSLTFTKYFSCPIQVQSYSNNISTSAQKEIENTLTKIDNCVSISNKDSYIFKFNNLLANQSVFLDDVVTEILQLAICGENSLYSITNEKFNVAVYPLKELWQEKNENVISGIVIPESEEIENRIRLCELTKVLSFNKENKTLTKLIDGAKIDLGGVAKGYAIDKIKTILENDGVTDGYISFGSSSIYVFNADTISIRHPRKDDKIIKIDNPTNVSISTSGDYERVFGEDSNGRKYSHIIDTKKGEPTNTGVISATVIGDNGAILDGLSTSLMLCEFDFENRECCELTALIQQLLQRYSNYIFFVCYDKGNEKYLITNEDESNFSLLDTEYFVVNI